MAQGMEKPEKNVTPSVAIDGSRIRIIRESKKLTQLYVASVVGVTTDTISRWENNRYPSIKRDNAEKLATALEVGLGEILRQEEIKEPEPEPPTPPRRSTLWLVVASSLLALVVLTVFLLVRQPWNPATAVRWAPRFAAPGEVIPLQIKVTRRPSDTGGFILKDKVPAGFRAVSSTPRTSATDGRSSSMKWLVPGGSASVTVSYTLQVPATPLSSRDVPLDGEVVTRSGGRTRSEPIAGSRGIRIGPYHWADSNGDGRIDDDEIMPAYYVCEAMKGMGLDWPTIEAIWSGKGYRWDERSGYIVK